jgi:hypothetical protein
LEQLPISLCSFHFNLLQIRQHISPEIRKANDEASRKKSAARINYKLTSISAQNLNSRAQSLRFK